MVSRIESSIKRDARFWISNHAIRRLRERGEHAIQSMTDRDLAIVLDERLFDAFASEAYESVVDSKYPDVDTKVATIECRDSVKRFVVLRPYRPSEYPQMRTVVGPSSGSPALAAITVLTMEMVTQNYHSKRWCVPNRATSKVVSTGDFQNRPLAALSKIEPATISRSLASEQSSLQRKYTLGGTRAERSAFVLEMLREDPDAPMADVRDRVRKKFGTPMNHTLVEQLRARVLAEIPKTDVVVPCATAAPTPVLSIVRPQTLAVPEPAPAPQPSAAPSLESIAANPNMSIAIQYAQALEGERLARARVQNAERELEAAQESLRVSSSQVDMLMAQMQRQRSAS
ncbi:MAG: hypothetical protein ACTHU0_02725 [Kofleriaceae bacterium]